MASPYAMEPQNPNTQLVPMGSVAEGEADDIHNIPRRLMGVKVLYTFDGSESTCLARLAGAKSIPVVSLDEHTQVGVIEVKSCVKAIVAASPELVAKLGRDYTVYAYDFSEYDTPLVGQGMLSWILAAASETPHAPANESQTMVTGRVCRNFLGLFSKGTKETLEVKLKLVPVPTCLQSEYVDSMEKYHNLSRVMPEGLDYKEWAEFLKTNPTITQLAHPAPHQPFQPHHHPSRGATPDMHRPSMGNFDPRTPAAAGPPSQNQDRSRDDRSFLPQQSYGSRPCSPTPSNISFSHYQPPQYRRPSSRASIRNDAPFTGTISQDSMPYQQEEGQAKRRVHVIQATRPKKTPLLAQSDSLRVTASTAASVRLHRPANSTAAELTAMEQVPRAPTPRPGDLHRPRPRASTGGRMSALARHDSMNESRPSPLNYDSAMFSDTAAESADDERGNSPGDTPMDIPSSPPILPQQIASSAPSSPGLPALPYPADSGFVSDMVQGPTKDNIQSKTWEGSDLPTITEKPRRARRDTSHVPWTHVTPGPMELLPQSWAPKPAAQNRGQAATDKSKKAHEDPSAKAPVVDSAPSPPNGSSNQAGKDGKMQAQASQMSTEVTPFPFENTMPQDLQQGFPLSSQPCQPPTHGPGPYVAGPIIAPLPTTEYDASLPASTRVESPKPPVNRSKSSKSRSLPRSQTWSGEPMSDAPMPETGSRQPRSGAGAKRSWRVTEQLEESLAKGQMPTYCNNCGEIDTPVWRKTFTRIEFGLPTDLQLSTDGSGIVGFEMIQMAENDHSEPKYRVFKTNLDKADRKGGSYQEVNLCNPCGLWLNKKSSMRPPELWSKRLPGSKQTGEKRKRKRNPPKGANKRTKGAVDDIRSDAAISYADTTSYNQGNLRQPSAEGKIPEEAKDTGAAQSSHLSTTTRMDENHSSVPSDDYSAMMALQRAIQSSPGAFPGSRRSPINLEPDLTPKSGRRLLFPSPRRPGEFKSLDEGASISPSANAQKLAAMRSQPSMHGGENVDKENCPPSPNEYADLAHLFDEDFLGKITPKKGLAADDLLKTPTPSSRKRTVLSTKSNADLNIDNLLKTPSRNPLTPSRKGRTPIAAPDTPFTRQLNAMLSDCLSSPSKAIDFSAFSPFPLTPGRTGGQQIDYSLYNDFLSSDMPAPSSPSGGFNFAVFEDATADTVGVWSGASIFGSSDAVAPQPQEETAGAKGVADTDMAIDFSHMVDVVATGSDASQVLEQPSVESAGVPKAGVCAAEVDAMDVDKATEVESASVDQGEPTGEKGIKSVEGAQIVVDSDEGVAQATDAVEMGTAVQEAVQVEA